MGLLQKIKSALGLDGATSRDRQPSGDVDVTVEREPSTEDEDAVKGTDTSSQGEPADDENTDESADADDGESDAVVDEAAADAHAASAEEPDADEAADEADPEGSSDPVTELNGIGPAYAERLSGQGIETVGELAVADPEAIAAETDLGANRVANWVEQARAY
jgi:predicted flap endonuclease-1-like 5' DNA nuclease